MKKQRLHSLENYDPLDLERPSGERWVTMQNSLIRAGQGLSLSEKRLVMLAISILDSRKNQKHGDIPTTKITAAEYASTYNIDANTAYDQLQSSSKQLFDRAITFFEPAHKRNGTPLKPIQGNMRWVGECHYHEGEGFVELYWWPRLLPYLTGIKRQFTSYQLQQASALRSIYSWRLLELLLRFESTGIAEYTVEDFKASMDAPPSLSDFGQVKRRIIEPAVKELREKDGWLINWKPIKTGRKVSKINFTFSKDPQLKLDL